MKKSTKTAIAAGIAGTAAVMGAAELMYESILNIKFSDKMMKILRIEDQKMLDILYHDPTLVDGYKWMYKIQPEEKIIVDTKGNEIHAYMIKNPENTGKWAVCSHGYRANPKAEAPYAKHLYKQGFSIIFPHMSAHENDTSKYSSMGYKDKDIILACIDYLTLTDPDCKILLHGVSMGASATLLATGEYLPPNVKCAVSDCAFSDCRSIFSHVMQTNLHLKPFPLLNAANMISKARGNFDFNKCRPISAVTRSITPTLFIHGTADNFIPYEMMNELYDACTAEKDRLDVPDAIHATAIAFAPEEYLKKLDEFKDKYI